MVVPWILTNTVENESIHTHQMKKGVENLHTRKPSTSFLRFGLALPCYAITRSLENEFAVVSWSCFYPKKRVCQSLAKKIRRTDFPKSNVHVATVAAHAIQPTRESQTFLIFTTVRETPILRVLGQRRRRYPRYERYHPMAEMSSHLRR